MTREWVDRPREAENGNQVLGAHAHVAVVNDSRQRQSPDPPACPWPWPVAAGLP